MSQLEEKKLPNEVKAGLKREEKQKKVDWWKKHWKWVVPSVVAGLVAVIALLLLIVTSIIADIQSRQTLKVLKACLSDVEVSEDMTELVVPSNRCNSEEVTRLDLGRFRKLKKIEVGSYSFESVGEVRVSGLSELESVVVGESSFSQKEGSVVVKNCGVLKELRVGDGSFIHFSELKMEAVPVLESVRVGRKCFENGNELRLMSLKGLKSVVIGEGCFSKRSGGFYVTDCPLVSELKIGKGSFANYRVLEIKNVGALESVVVEKGFFENVEAVRLTGLSGLKSVVVGEGSFSKRSGELRIRDCGVLRELRVGNGAFKSYGVFELEGVGALEGIVVGDECFTSSSIVLKGM